ncbi:hypothetical protein TCE0_039r12877 [Talaromyces pinophilus]|uniref:DNA-directed DNA polymerase n=1 Tax=Talaromyces pinophilus TaxID=128442 RepID=A0A6N4SL92_TALPI|nr:hypothetical protein TCE0_039r12877 [Talaromyces pinophilus]
MSYETPSNKFLQPPSGEEYQPEYRAPSAYTPLHTFQLPKADSRQYQQQYGDLYFLRLAKLKPAAEKVGREAWDGFTQIAGEKARKVDRVLDVRQGALCWVTGTIYMDLPLKPNILDDVAKDNYAAAPPPRKTYLDPSNPDMTQVVLEDESGRLRMTGSMLRTTHLVTGVIIAVLGTENANGDFEVIDIKVPDFPPQPPRWEKAPTDKTASTIKRIENTTGKSSKIAFISGLGITGSSSDTLTLELLTDYLLGYTETGEEDDSPARISRLIIAGNSLGNVETITAAATMNGDAAAKKKAPKKYGYDASSYNASPITQLDNFLSELLPSIPVTIMPGESDPANFSLPQQGIHRAMLPRAKQYCSDGLPGDTSVEPGWFDNVTNPWEGYVDGWRLWGCSGQNVDDVLRYLDFADASTNGEGDGETSVQIMEAMLRWRCAVPTAPDTLWCYPFQTHDPFILQACPHLFFIGNQPQFKTVVVESEPRFRLDGPDTEMGNSADEPTHKLTFIACLPLSSPPPPSSLAVDTAVSVSEGDDAPERMIGDTNLFLRYDDDDDDDDEDDQPERERGRVIGEIELMIAEKRNQGQGFGRGALLTFLWYIVNHEGEILDEFAQSTTAADEGSKKRRKMKCLSVKIGKDNARSLALFESLGFEKRSPEPNYFGEFELRRYGLDGDAVAKLADAYGLKDYTELNYKGE